MRRVKPKLVVLGGPMDGLEFDVDKQELTIGRLHKQDVCLPLDQAVSRRHAQLIVEGDEYWLKDVGSTYGTFIAGSEDKIEDRVKIVPGITFRLGPQTTLKLMLEDVEKKVVQRADRLMRWLDDRLSEVPPEKWAILKARLVTILRRMDEVNSEEELMPLLQDMAQAIEEALGVPAGLRPLPAPGKPDRESAAPPEEGSLESLRTFFKSNLGEIVERMEAEESGEVSP